MPNNKLLAREPTAEMIRAVDIACHEHWPNARKMAVAMCHALWDAAPSLATDPAISPDKLREALGVLKWFADHRQPLIADVSSAHSGRGPGASSFMREDDSEFRAELRQILERASAILALATKEERTDKQVASVVTEGDHCGQCGDYHAPSERCAPMIGDRP